MSVSIKKIPGVESVNVSLKHGLVSITLKPGNTVTLTQVRKAIKDDAFAPKEARVVGVGELAAADGRLRFKVAGTNEVFPVESTPHALWRKQTGKSLLVNGIISDPTNRSDTGILQITGTSEAGATNGKE
ncbi:MAG TPA: heavy metal-associated domain-containing protein [Candidatus Acidoferrales bacterium]|nr:heavy metal-associated domain-containing protein [Candidatus Acidoferrales bacterium]